MLIVVPILGCVNQLLTRRQFEISQQSLFTVVQTVPNQLLWRQWWNLSEVLQQLKCFFVVFVSSSNVRSVNMSTHYCLAFAAVANAEIYSL